MIGRRDVLQGVAVAGAAIAASAGQVAQAAVPKTWGDVELRGNYPEGRLERVHRSDLESRLDFVEGFRKWSLRDFGQRARKNLEAKVTSAGLDPSKSPSVEKLLELIGDDRAIWTNVRCRTTAQQLMWRTLADAYRADSSLFLAELESAERASPQNLKLNPDIAIPEYAKHEIHIQPGGYIGDALAGYIYTYGVNTFLLDLESEDRFHVDLAQLVPTPADGKVGKILDLATGVGQLAMALKHRFPKSEVWGLDVGAPMLRHAHMRSVDAGLDIKYVQALAETTGFPDASFDVVTAYILFHEVPTSAATDILREVSRILRPGGVFYPVDFKTHTESPPTAWSRFAQWWDHIYNNELWSEEFRTSDFRGMMKDAGLVVSEGPSIKGGSFWNRIVGTKPVA